MDIFDEEDNRELSDIGPDEPCGQHPVTFNIPIPREEQIAGEIARQLISGYSYDDKSKLLKRAQEIVEETLSQIISERARPMIEELLSKPLQRTDGFGNAVGEPTSLEQTLAGYIAAWGSEVINSEGKPAKPNGYNSGQIGTRISWELGRLVDSEMSRQVRAETDKIVKQLKDSATQKIASQIAEQVSKLVLK